MRDRNGDKVTISLWSKEIKADPGYTSKFRDEISNIKKIYDGLLTAAITAGRKSPHFIVSILLIPDWKREDNSYQDTIYSDKKNRFIQEVKNSLDSIDNMAIEDFYFEADIAPEGKAYMHNLDATGTNADMIKTVAIINNSNSCRHLQIDSNTVVPSYKDLYEKTFQAQEQKDGINASYYDDFYISAHNKMVYTTPTGLIATDSQLSTLLWEWCKVHKDDNNIDGDKHREKNSIYSKVFTKALHQIDYVKAFTLANQKTVYPATLNDKVYWLTHCMVTAVNMSWSATGVAMDETLLKLQPVPIGDDGLFNYPCLVNVIKKHTGNLRIHSKALKLTDTSGRGDVSRELFLQLSNSRLELQAARQFIKGAFKTVPILVAGLFEESENGNKLTNELFECTVNQLKERAKASSSTASELNSNAEEDKKEKTSRPNSGR